MSYFVVVSIMTSVFSTFLDLVVGRVEWPTCHVGGHGPKIPMSDLFVFGPHIHARSNEDASRYAVVLIERVVCATMMTEDSEDGSKYVLGNEADTLICEKLGIV